MMKHLQSINDGTKLIDKENYKVDTEQDETDNQKIEQIVILLQSMNK